MSVADSAHRYAIIVAGGKGLRMGAEIPKQFLPIGRRPILMRTIELFVPFCKTIILVLPQEQQAYWESLCQQYQFSIPHQICNGGETRFESVRNGLTYLEQMEGRSSSVVVAIHDGVRPFASEELINECFGMAEQSQAVIPYRPVVDSLRHISSGANHPTRAVKREEYISIQTPQVFHLDTLIRAYQTEYRPEFTDDASVWEAVTDLPISLVLGNNENIKVTTPLDLILAEELCRRLSDK